MRFDCPAHKDVKRACMYGQQLARECEPNGSSRRPSNSVTVVGSARALRLSTSISIEPCRSLIRDSVIKEMLAMNLPVPRPNLSHLPTTSSTHLPIATGILVFRQSLTPTATHQIDRRLHPFGDDYRSLHSPTSPYRQATVRPRQIPTQCQAPLA